jgi:hypothetical protein
MTSVVSCYKYNCQRKPPSKCSIAIQTPVIETFVFTCNKHRDGTTKDKLELKTKIFKVKMQQDTVP